MQPWSRVGLLATLAVMACEAPRAPQDRGTATASTFGPAQAAAIEDSVLAFADTVARGVSQRGPAAWRAYLADSPAFFMASEGQLVFANSAAASRGIEGLRRSIARIELTWGDGMRVDPLAPGLAVLATPYREVRIDRAGRRIEEVGYFTGLAEHRAGGWQLRDAHWSVAASPSLVP